MNIRQGKSARKGAFSLIEVAVCTAVISIIFVSLYGGIASGFGLVNLARENLRANQILIEKMETIRLYNWDQINSNGFIPRTFTAPFFPPPVNSTNAEASGVTYYGTMIITNATFEAEYATNMRMVTVTLTWTNAGLPRTRELQTLVTQNGIQNYVYY
jgi:prepilin-type N-terminal cleavage/methylation domain-containing protein